jgi:CheY-like chemotaxis protein
MEALVTTKLLAVDDSKTMRKVLEITFAGDNFDPTIVGSAAEALASLRSKPPQVVVVDGALGGTSGYDLCKQIKAESPGVKVLLLSSKQRPYDAAQGEAAGVDDHFDKPFDSNKFLDKLGALELGAAAAPAAQATAPRASAPAATPAFSSPSASPPAAVPRPAVSSPAPAHAATLQTSVAPQRPQAPPARVPSAAPVAAPFSAPPSSAAPPATYASSRPASPVAAAVANGAGAMSDKLQGMGLTSEQVQGVLALSREVLEQVVWEVVTNLAETLIKEEIARLMAE